MNDTRKTFRQVTLTTEEFTDISMSLSVFAALLEGEKESGEYFNETRAKWLDRANKAFHKLHHSPSNHFFEEDLPDA